MNKKLLYALIFTFLAHGAAMLGMAIFLLPMVPGGGGGTDAERITRIATSPWLYRLGWLGWQITALSDLLLGLALLKRDRLAIAQLILVILAIIPDQLAQFGLVTHGVELAKTDPQGFLAFEAKMFPLTSGWAAILYTLSAIGWALCLRKNNDWSRFLERLSPPMLFLFTLISIAPLLPTPIRPSAELIGGGNAVAFTILEVWFAAAIYAVSSQRGGFSFWPKRR